MTWGGFAQGLVAGTNLGSNIVNAYESGKASQLADKRRKEDEEIAAAMRAGYEGGDPNAAPMTAAQLNPQQQAQLGANLAAQGGPGDASGPTTPGLTPQSVARDSRSDEERYLDAYSLAQRKAMEIGRPDVALRAFDAALPVRHRMRQDAYNKADQQFRLSGGTDFSAFVPFYNRFVNDGRMVDKIESTEIGNEKAFRIVGKEADGSPLQTGWMSNDQMKEVIGFVLDPAAVRAAEVEQRKRLVDLQTDIAKERAKKPFIEMDPTKSYFTFDGKQIKAGSRIERIKDADGNEQLVVVGNDNTQTPIMAGSREPDGALTKAERKDVWDPANSALENDVKVAAANIPDERRAQVLGNARSLLGNLVLANRGNANGAGRDPGILSRVAAGLAAGTLKPTKVKLDDGLGTQADAVVMPDGAVVYVNPQQVRASTAKVRQRDDAVASAPTAGQNPAQEPAVRGKGSPENFPRVTPEQQRARDSDRIKIIEDELAAEKAKPDTPQRATNIAALERELALSRKQVGQPVGQAAAPAAAQVPPASAPQAPAPAGVGMQPVAPPAPAAPTPAQPGLAPIANDDGTESIGKALDAARVEFKRAEEAYYAYGTNQKRADPEGFKRAEAAVKEARSRRQLLEKQWQSAVKGTSKTSYAMTR